MKGAHIVLLFLFCIGSVCAVFAEIDHSSSAQFILDEALALFEQQKNREAIGALNVIYGNPDLIIYHPEALYWIAQIKTADGNFQEAQSTFQTIITHYPQSERLEAAVYHRARLHYYTGAYKQAIISLASFRERFPQSQYVGNSFYWSGLALSTIGKNSEAIAMYERVIYGFPTSYRIDAAQYQLALLRLKEREGNLLELVRWTHAEYLALLQDVNQAVSQADITIQTVQQNITSEEDEMLLNEYRRQVERLRLEVDGLKKIEVGSNLKGAEGTAIEVDIRAQALLDLKEQFEQTRLDILEKIDQTANEQLSN